MISKLYLDNCFSHQDRTFVFEDGLTGVIGRNEAGKSLIVEMIRYALFGSKALRGKADDYKKLHVELDFLVEGKSYVVVRKGTKTELSGAVTASGTKPVNAAIERILGYGLDVFDVANVCNQGDVEALSDMRPAERKAMVDRTVGLDQLDGLIRYCGDEGNALRREAAAIESSLVEPVKPEQPEGYIPSKDIPLQEARESRDEWLRLRSYLDNAPTEPREPEPYYGLGTVEELEQHQEGRAKLVRQLEEARSKRDEIVPETYTEEQLQTFQIQLDAADRLHDLRRQRARLSPEVHSAEDLDDFEQWLNEYDDWQKKQKLLVKGYHECPSCGHQWPVADLGYLEEAKETGRPPLTRRDIAEHRARLGNNERIASLDDEIVLDVAVGDSPLSQREIRDHRRQIGNTARRHELDMEISDLEKDVEETPDLSEELRKVSAYNHELRQYQEAIKAYRKYNAEVEKVQTRLRDLGDTDWNHEVDRLQNLFDFSKSYERDLEKYNKDSNEYEAQYDDLSERRNRGNAFLSARDRIKELKVSMKSHLLPSLNQVASVLLSRMTGGERSRVEISDDFDIEIDGQGIQTLSGSGKAVANLAIRIALGQILTNRVFSVFMADEVDAAMDDERATYTAEALTRLREMVKQVVLVTHKRPDTNRTIEL